VIDRFREAIDAAFTAAAVPLAPGALEAFARWAELLATWNRRIALTTIVEPRDVAERHLLDASLVSIDPAPAEHLVDVGSGAGVPGLPVAVLRPDLQVTVVERVAKKVAFLRAAVDALKLSNVTVLRTDLAALPAAGFDRAVSRALMGPAQWIAAARRIVRPDGHVGLMVARESELPEGVSIAQVRRVTLPSDGAERVLAWVRV